MAESFKANQTVCLSRRRSACRVCMVTPLGTSLMAHDASAGPGEEKVVDAVYLGWWLLPQRWPRTKWLSGMAGRNLFRSQSGRPIMVMYEEIV